MTLHFDQPSKTARERKRASSSWVNLILVGGTVSIIFRNKRLGEVEGGGAAPPSLGIFSAESEGWDGGGTCPAVPAGRTG
jgi:hypothetical protein